MTTKLQNLINKSYEQISKIRKDFNVTVMPLLRDNKLVVNTWVVGIDSSKENYFFEDFQKTSKTHSSLVNHYKTINLCEFENALENLKKTYLEFLEEFMNVFCQVRTNEFSTYDWAYAKKEEGTFIPTIHRDNACLFGSKIHFNLNRDLNTALLTVEDSDSLINHIKHY